MPANPTQEAEAEVSSDSAQGPPGTETSAFRRTLFLAVLTAIAFAVLWYGFHQSASEVGPMPALGGLLWLAVGFFAVCTACAGISRWTVDTRALWARAVRLVNAVPLIWFQLATACLASFVIGQVANSQPAPRNYWPLFALWLVCLGAVLVSIAAGLRWSEFKPGALRQRLWPYRWELAGLAGLTLAGAILRVVILTSLPFPFEQDEAAMAHESLHVMEGVTKNMFMSGLQGHPIMQFLAQGIFLKVFGVNVFGIRMISAMGGIISIPLFYLLLRQIFGRPIAIIGAVYLTGYHLHIAYSRIGMENIGDPLLMIVTFYFAWRASREGKASDFVLLGLTMGLGLYLYQGSRVVPLIVAAYFGYCFLRRPTFLRRLLPGTGMMALAYGAAAFPLAIFWFTHQSFFMDRINTVGIFQSHWIDQQRAATGDSTLTILWQQAVDAFSGFGFRTERGIFYAAPIPFVDKLSLIPFLLGLAYALYKVFDERYFLLLTGFAAVVLTGGVLTVEPPMASRLLGSVPIVVAFIAIGIKLIADAVSRWKPSASMAVAGVAVFALATTNIHFYFFEYKDGGYSSDLNNRVAAQVVDYARTLPEDTRLFWYGDPRMYLSGSGHPAMTFPLRDRPRMDVLRDGRVVSNPPVNLSGEAPSVFMFLPHRLGEMQALMDSCPGGEFRSFIMPAGRHGLQGVQPADVSFVAYEVLTPNDCLPLTAGR